MVVKIRTTRRLVRISPRKRGETHGGENIEEFQYLWRILEDFNQRRYGFSKIET